VPIIKDKEEGDKISLISSDEEIRDNISSRERLNTECNN
jgi:hypothetical protein